MTNPSRRRGFTVIELVVVVALVGIMVGVVAPSFASLDRRMTNRDATGPIDALVRLAKASAVERATKVIVTIDPGARRFWLEPPDTTGLLVLPEDASLVSRAKRVHIRVEPNGEASIDEALFVLRGDTTTPVGVGR
jgi:prepilin-type N-terminal cleavage/methylation domain-containing protein